MKLKLMLLSTCAAASLAYGWEYDQVDTVDLDPLGRLVSEWRGAKPRAPRKVLWFSECFGYNHHGGRCYGDWTFLHAGETSGAWEIVQLKDVKKLGDTNHLAGFDAIVFNNSTGVSEALAPGLTAALTGFVKGGKGIALIHSGLDAFKDSDELLDLFGGYFRGHPWHADGTWRFLNEQPADPINASFRNEPASFSRVDEIYQFPAFFDRRHCKVLISMDLTDSVTKEAECWWNRRFGVSSTRPDHDYAVSWTREVGKGRIFYTSFGHDRPAFLDRARLYHMFAGLQYVLGDLTEEVASRHGPAIAELRTDWAAGPWMEKIDARVKAAKGQALDLAILGDSITMGWTFPKTHKYKGGKEVWERHFGQLKTLNLGVSGDRTEHLLWRIAKQGQADGWTAKTIFVMIGVNNFGQRRPGCVRPDTPTEAASGTKAILNELRTKHPESRIVLLGALPWSSPGGFKWIREYNAILATLTEGKVEFHDIGGAFLNSPNEQKRELFNDGLHPNPDGYEVFAQQLEKILEADK